MKFLGQGFQKLQHEQERQTQTQTDRRDRTLNNGNDQIRNSQVPSKLLIRASFNSSS